MKRVEVVYVGGIANGIGYRIKGGAVKMIAQTLMSHTRKAQKESKENATVLAMLWNKEVEEAEDEKGVERKRAGDSGHGLFRSDESGDRPGA